MRDARRSADLAVLVNGFPRLSETFVLQELLDLERRGVRLIVFALSRPAEAVRQEALLNLRAQVEYVPEAAILSRRRMARARVAVASARGASYLTARVGVSGSPGRTPAAMKRATVLAQRLLQLGSPPLYIHFAHKPGTIGRLAARLAGVRYAISCHAKDIWATPPEELAPKLRDAELVLTCTAAGRDELARLAAGATPVQLAYHGVDVESVVPRVIVSGPPRVLSAGRLVEKKGHDTLIRAGGLLRDRNVPYVLRIAGEGIEWPRLQRLVHELDLAGHVAFLGPLSPVELRSEYASASLFALACRQLATGDRDGLPNVVLEAMVQGLPVVGTALPGIAEAIDHDHTGLLVEPDSPEALADALERVLTDPQLAERLGASARASVCERFDHRLLLPAVAEALAGTGLIPRRTASPSPLDVSTPALEPA